MLQCLKFERDRGSDNATDDMSPSSHRFGEKHSLVGQRRSVLKCTRESVSSSYYVA